MERDDGNHPLHPTAAYGQRVPSAQLAAYMARHRMGGFLWDFSSDRMSLEPGALAVFDFEPGEFDGRVASLHDRMVAGDLPVLQPRAEDMSGAGEYGGYFRVVARDGTRRWAHVQGSIQRGGNGDPLGAVGFIRDATLELSQVADETVLASARQEQAEIVRSISASLSRVVTVQDLLSFLTRPSFLEVVGASDTTLSVLDNDREKLLATRGLPNDLLGLPPDLFQDLNMDSAMPVPEAIRLQRPLFITREDVRVRYPQLWPYVEPSDLTSAAILPLAAEGRPTGGMSIMYEGRKGFTPEERNLLEPVRSIM